MEQFITLQRCGETVGGREAERVAFFYGGTRRVRASLCPLRHCSRIVELLFRNLRFLSGGDCASWCARDRSRGSLRMKLNDETEKQEERKSDNYSF